MAKNGPVYDNLINGSMSYTYNEQRNSKKCIQNTPIYPIVMKSCTLLLVWSDALVSFTSFFPYACGHHSGLQPVCATLWPIFGNFVAKLGHGF